MPTTNIFIYAWLVVWQLAKDLLLFPLWWYTVGFFKCVRWAGNFLADWWQALGIGVWLKYLFVPMYGQRDIAGRFISFFMRLFQIIFKSIFFFIWVIFTLVIIVLWLALPIFIIYQILNQLTGLYAG